MRMTSQNSTPFDRRFRFPPAGSEECPALADKDAAGVPRDQVRIRNPQAAGLWKFRRRINIGMEMKPMEITNQK